MTERESEKLLKEEDKIKRAFVDHTWAEIRSEESWRVFKIMSEFVEGIDKMAKIILVFRFLAQLVQNLITLIISWLRKLLLNWFAMDMV
jgi:hypothetical protein